MRVISGTAKGRPLKPVPGSGTRPTTDKVKEAIFSMIGPYSQGGTVLDLFAGTGGLGIEALSRGMDAGIFIDADRVSVQVIRDNLKAAGFENKAELYRNEAAKAVKLLARRGIKIDLLFLDPPYRFKDMDELLMHMLELELFGDAATIVVEHDAKHHYPEIIHTLQQMRRAEYGDIAVSIYKNHIQTESTRLSETE